MKRLLIIFLLFAVPAFGQPKTDSVFHLNKLSKDDTPLSGWKFHDGDDPRWAGPTFDDSKWQPADPSQDITLFKPLKKSRIGWIRLHIVVDSSVTKQQLNAWVSQNTASEIYLNGKLIKKYGSVSSDPSKIKAWSPVEEWFDLKLQPNTEQVIAVRLGYEPNLPYCSGNFVTLPAFIMYVNSHDNAQANALDYQSDVTAWIIIWSSLGGIFLIISFIYLIYYLFDKHEKTNVYYFIFSILNLALFIIAIPYYNNIPNVSAQMWIGLLFAVIFIPAYLFMVLTVYALFQYQRRTIFKILVLAGIGALCYLLFIDGAFGFLLCANGYITLTSLEGARISIWAIRRKKKYAWIIMVGFILGAILSVWAARLSQETILAQILNGSSVLGFPAGMVFYLGLQIALTNKKLRSMLVEVQTLSREKQQILADQNEQLEQQVTARTAELNQSLTELKSTQSQLIQREKMASLGELTAGIAHEIQNPLNFVNNFSEVNTELIEEMEHEIDKGDMAEVKVIAGDIKVNQQKISQHGKRADFIVKGMLQHSRTSTGEKQPTNMNVLCEEFLKLSYHGLRAKDKSFYAETATQFDPNLPRINVVQQDIGRVMLNLFNNAFYAVNQKVKTAGADYKPAIEVSTSQQNGSIFIKIKDNGNGIPDAIKDKIMQPFFTTKPTGEGTGLGLSLSYDIVVKGHGGTITVNSTNGEGADFIIGLPLLF